MRVAHLIREKLTAALNPVQLEVVDESHRHAGHAGSRPGGETHFRVEVVATAFEGKSRLERQRLVYAALRAEMSHQIHALSVIAKAPAEASQFGVRVRPHATVELDELIALFRASVQTAARGEYTLAQVLAWAPEAIDRESWAMRLAAGTAWVAAQGDRVLGFINLEPDGHLDMLFVHPDCLRRGVASLLLDRLEVSARARGLARLFTEASIIARPFFERRGFSVIETQTVVRLGQKLTNYRMERQLA